MKMVFLLVLLWVWPCFAFNPEVVKSKHFEALKLYSDEDYVLRDAIEFSIFDMSDIKFINDSEAEGALDAVKETKDALESLPKYFYKNLKNQIAAQLVPVTLFSDTSPNYTKPLKLYIKIKRIHLWAKKANSDGSFSQPISLRIYGQLKDKRENKILAKFYDSVQTEFTLGGAHAPEAFDTLTQTLMKNLSLYLKTQY